jgi:hypothetical protein
MISDVAEFWIYPERGEVLGFVDDRLIYREQLATQRLHKLAKQWRYEQQFKTRLETPVPAP